MLRNPVHRPGRCRAAVVTGDSMAAAANRPRSGDRFPPATARTAARRMEARYRAQRTSAATKSRYFRSGRPRIAVNRSTSPASGIMPSLT